MKKQKRTTIIPRKMTRKERRALRNIHMPHTKSSSRATITTASDTLRRALTEGFPHTKPNDVRIEFGKFLTKTYDMSPATAYNKLRYWHVEEWEVIGFYNMIANFIHKHMEANTFFPTTLEEARMWHASMPRGTKMIFYNYIAERGMCRIRFTRIINGHSTISRLKQEGLSRAYSNYVDSEKSHFPAYLGLE